MKTLRAGAAIAAAVALTLTACSGGDTTDDETTAADTPAATGSSLSGTLQGTGASSMKAAQEVWTVMFAEQNPDVTVNYSPEGSGAGRTAFSEGGANFAGSDRALKDDEMGGTFSQCAADTKPVNLPVYISPIAITYTLDGVDELNLTADVIAKIFTGEIDNWNDEAIAALNPDAELPDLTITPVHRSDDSGTTENFTATLSQVAPEVWTYEPDGEWPADLGGEAAQGTSGVVAAVNGSEGAIGYADASGLEDGMKTALYSLDGSEDFVGPEAEAAAAIVEASERVEGREDNDYALDLDRTASGYPFVLVAYAIACTEYEDPAIGELVGAYLTYITSDEGQADAQPQAGNAPLTGELATGVQEVAASIK